MWPATASRIAISVVLGSIAGTFLGVPYLDPLNWDFGLTGCSSTQVLWGSFSEPEESSTWAARVLRPMVLRRWGKIYHRTGLVGETLLLVEKLNPADGGCANWTVVNSLRQVRVINTRDKRSYTLRKMPGPVFAAFVPLTAAEQTAVLNTSANLVTRAAAAAHGAAPPAGVPPAAPAAAPAAGPPRRRRARHGADWIRGRIEWGFKMAGDAGALSLSYWACGFWGISGFISLKVASALGVFDAIVAGYGYVKEMVELVETGREALDTAIDLYNEGQLDTIIVIIAVFLMGLCYLKMRKGTPDPAVDLPDPKTPPHSPRQAGFDVSDADSDEEDPRFKQLAASQTEMAQGRAP